MSTLKAGAAAALATALLFVLLFAAAAVADGPAPSQVSDLPQSVDDGRSLLPQDPLDPRAQSTKVPSPETAAGPHRSFVGRVIDDIPPQYRFAVIGLGCLSLLLAGISLRERRRALRVQRQAIVDSLTRLPNRQAFERRLEKEWKRSERYDRPLGLVLLDLDDLKQINDTQGHAAGDAVLREVAAAVCSRIRTSDMAARLGGDEFVVICPETTTAGLAALARSLEDHLEQASIRTSVGFGERESTDHGPADVVARADAAMYRRTQTAREAPSRPLSVHDAAALAAKS